MAKLPPAISLGENISFNLSYVLPYYLRGIFTRNHFWYKLWSRYHPDPLGSRLISKLRQKYQSDYLYLRMLTTKSLLVLDRAGIEHILDNSPTIYADAKLKRQGMSHFQPNAVTISRGDEWAERRQFNEAVLNSHHHLHSFATSFLEIIRAEVAAPAFTNTASNAMIDWADFSALFERITLQVIFGKGVQEPTLIADYNHLLVESNRVFALRQSRHFDDFYQRLRSLLATPRPQSLAQVMSDTPATAQTRVENQPPHWLFAMKDTLAENVVPALALIVAHPQVEERVRHEMAQADLTSAQGIDSLRYLEACIQESMRLWPTTPVLARESVSDDTLEGIPLPKGTQVVIANTFTHRDLQIDGEADRFRPELWLDGEGGVDASGKRFSLHFSAGPQVCAGIDIALFIAKGVVATLLNAAHYRLLTPTLPADGPVPQTFNPFLAQFQRI